MSAIFTLTIALSPIDASSPSNWYCQRLVPPWITSTLTTCTFPCLFISTHGAAQIVVHNEPDGTLCKVPSELHHKTQVGRCRRGVCTHILGHEVLKRKKRFICLFTLARLLKAKKERRQMQQEITQLRQLALSNYNRGVYSARRSYGSRGNFPTVSTGVDARGGANNAGHSAIEIHILPGVEFRGSGTGVAGNLGSMSRRRGGIPSRNDGANGYGTGNSGRAGNTAPVSDIGETISSGSGGSRHIGGDVSGIGRVASNRAAVVGNIGVGGSALSAMGGGRDASATVGVADLRVITLGSSVARNGGAGGLGNGAGDSVAGGLVGVGGVVSTLGPGDRNDVDVRVGAVGASYGGRRTSASSRRGGASRPFPNLFETSSDSTGRRDDDMDAGSGFSRRNSGFVPTAARGDGFQPNEGGIRDFGDGAVGIGAADRFETNSDVDDVYRG